MNSKKLLLTLCIVLISLSSSPSAADDDDRIYTPIDISIIHPISLIPTSNKTIVGLGITGVYSKSHTVHGLQVGLFQTLLGEMNGVQIGLINTVDGMIRGFQFGLYNGGGSDYRNGFGEGCAGVCWGGIATSYYDVSGFMFGGIFNAAVNGSAVWQLSLGGNIINELDGGLQTGFGNFGGRVVGGQTGVFNLSGAIDGFQVGVINYATEVDGVQIGLINVAGNLKGFQIGGLNFASENGLPFMVGFNWGFE